MYDFRCVLYLRIRIKKDRVPLTCPTPASLPAGSADLLLRATVRCAVAERLAAMV